MKFEIWNQDLTLLVIYFTFLHILAQIKQVAGIVDEVKDITKDTNVKMEEGFDKAQGKHFPLSF